MASEEMSFKNVDGWMDGRMDACLYYMLMSLRLRWAKKQEFYPQF